MAWMKVDDTLHTNGKFRSIPKRMRFQCIGVYIAAGSWVAQQQTDGFIEPYMIEGLAPPPAAVRELVKARLWHEVEGGGYEINDWLVYNLSKAQYEERKKKDAERKRNQREREKADENQPAEIAENNGPAAAQPRPSRGAAVGDGLPHDGPNDSPRTGESGDGDKAAGQEVAPENVTRDVHSESGRPDPTRPDPTLITSGHRWAASNGEYAPEVEKPRGPAVDIDGWKLVRDAIPDEHPQASRSALALEAGALIKAGTKPETVRAALELWLAKPHLGPRTLPSLVSEVIRNRHAPARTGYGYGHDAATDKVTGWLELAQQLGQEAQA